MRWGCLFLVALVVAALAAFTYGGPLARFVGLAERAANDPTPTEPAPSRTLVVETDPADGTVALRLGARRWRWADLQDAERAAEFRAAVGAAAPDGAITLRHPVPVPGGFDEAAMVVLVDHLVEAGASSITLAPARPAAGDLMLR